MNWWFQMIFIQYNWFPNVWLLWVQLLNEYLCTSKQTEKPTIRWARRALNIVAWRITELPSPHSWVNEIRNEHDDCMKGGKIEQKWTIKTFRWIFQLLKSLKTKVELNINMTSPPPHDNKDITENLYYQIKLKWRESNFLIKEHTILMAPRGGMNRTFEFNQNFQITYVKKDLSDWHHLLVQI